MFPGPWGRRDIGKEEGSEDAVFKFHHQCSRFFLGMIPHLSADFCTQAFDFPAEISQGIDFMDEVDQNRSGTAEFTPFGFVIGIGFTGGPHALNRNQLS